MTCFEVREDARRDAAINGAAPFGHSANAGSTNPLERLNAEIKRRVFPNEAAITQLVGALLLEQNVGIERRQA